MKLLFLVSSLDLTQPFSATPAWWQLLKGLYEIGVEVIAAPYQGGAIESLWWRAEDNPARLYGDLFQTARRAARRVASLTPRPPLPSSKATKSEGEKEAPFAAEADFAIDSLHPSTMPPLMEAGEKEASSAGQGTPSLFPALGEWRGGGGGEGSSDSFTDRAARLAAQRLVAPLWHRHLDAILMREPDIDAVIILTAPLNHLNGIARDLQAKHGKPFFYYDGDVPASLPTMQGFASGFRIYQGADLGEYAAFISNSRGGADTLLKMGARAAHTLYYGADPDVFAPIAVAAQDLDVLFYGHGREYRAAWIDAMLRDASNALPDRHFATRGLGLGDIGRTRMLPYLSFSKLREYASRSRINLCITRAAHAGVYASSSSRPFELAAMGCAIVGNPYLGIEEWFEPEREIVIVGSRDEAIERIGWLLAHDDARTAMGRAARDRVLREHTFRHRARALQAIIQPYL